jgi:hypothetical protein
LSMLLHGHVLLVTRRISNQSQWRWSLFAVSQLFAVLLSPIHFHWDLSPGDLELT